LARDRKPTTVSVSFRKSAKHPFRADFPYASRATRCTPLRADHRSRSRTRGGLNHCHGLSDGARTSPAILRVAFAVVFPLPATGPAPRDRRPNSNRAAGGLACSARSAFRSGGISRSLRLLPRWLAPILYNQFPLALRTNCRGVVGTDFMPAGARDEIHRFVYGHLQHAFERIPSLKGPRPPDIHLHHPRVSSSYGLSARLAAAPAFAPEAVFRR
jgi:hypothetical protein